MLFRIFSGQQLEEDDVSAADKAPRFSFFNKWQWTPDTTAKLEQQDIKVHHLFSLAARVLMACTARTALDPQVDRLLVLITGRSLVLPRTHYR